MMVLEYCLDNWIWCNLLSVYITIIGFVITLICEYESVLLYCCGHG